MRRTTLITATLLTLSLAPALRAQSWGLQVQLGSTDGYGYGYGSGNFYPDVVHIDRVSELAHQLDETATYIHRQFERNNRRPDWAESRAMLQLHALNEQAAHFHDEVESYRQDPRHTAGDFARLEQAFRAADRSLQRIAPRPYVDHGMERIYVLMNELSRYYGRRSGYGHWGAYDRGHGHYGHDDGYDHNGYDPGDYDQDGDYGDPPYRR
jgi:hypothetical protein